ncbi:tripartite tricarboxylate transporter TctB family protein [Effusibacillus dendaii]|uniref:DUF1468 domain-containing protein n=1 Tax=Effusibacillus dendaii TaxID=2743772 RepID=A0A7I8DIM8_9BACL|nr:tripartite tricarboxylate transporter TctB family protein [Effusibacillus dendaii]BCJ87701.1 hypothetical protein skT53_26860 [Effusibacillus dendaii]
MKKGEMMISIIIISLCIVFLWMLRDFPPALSKEDVGPALFPGILLGVLLILSIVQLFMSIRGKSILVKLVDNKLQIVAGGLLLLYILLIPILGYLLVTPLFLVILSRLLKVKSWMVSVFYSLAMSGLIWYFFEKVSGVPLPSGIL